MFPPRNAALEHAKINKSTNKRGRRGRDETERESIEDLELPLNCGGVERRKRADRR